MILFELRSKELNNVTTNHIAGLEFNSSLTHRYIIILREL
jgi:hypothetical protein